MGDDDQSWSGANARIGLEGLRRAMEAVTPRDLSIPEGTPVLSYTLRESVANSVATGDLIKLNAEGPLHTVIGKQGNTVFLVEGSYQRKRVAYDQISLDGRIDRYRDTIAERLPPTVKQPKEFKPPVIVGKRRIRLDE